MHWKRAVKTLDYIRPSVSIDASKEAGEYRRDRIKSTSQTPEEPKECVPVLRIIGLGVFQALMAFKIRGDTTSKALIIVKTRQVYTYKSQVKRRHGQEIRTSDKTHSNGRSSNSSMENLSSELDHQESTAVEVAETHAHKLSAAGLTFGIMSICTGSIAVRAYGNYNQSAFGRVDHGVREGDRGSNRIKSVFIQPLPTVRGFIHLPRPIVRAIEVFLKVKKPRDVHLNSTGFVKITAAL
ncbi:hypothetical protein K435DRAFT_887458 [Dendrothele bispora CBS 962.96]|uniref:Uncharacterized protein n=1 Tax=Dendrothele bispora (strain CBS 962.96) TaxID=1314807 RepID=A0A4S8M6L1_DENBC|nr:hypothetical protein K435DRAFT_887458 [Dendrothele bispora CBS 962.96]